MPRQNRRRRLPRLVQAICGLLLIGAGLAPAISVGAGPAAQANADWPIARGHFYTQARGDVPAGHGFAVVDDADARMWTEFQRLGGVDRAGYPISHRFVWDGFVSQAFQKAVFQWRPDEGRVYFVNVFDEFTRAGLDGWLQTVRSTPPPVAYDETGLAWDTIVDRRLALLNGDPAIRDAFTGTDDWLALHGLPLGPVMDYGNVRVLRAQRVILQRWLVDTPWARAGQVVFANGGDVAKEAGLLAAAALAPENGAAYPAVSQPAAPAPAGTPAPVLPSGPDEAGSRLSVPSGFAVRDFATELEGTKPRLMTVGPDGEIYVALMTAGQIVRLPDRDRDGRADGVEVFADGLSLPHGLEWRDGWLYVAEGDRVESFLDTDGDGQADRRELVTDNIPPPRGHVSRTLHFGPDGLLYVSTGSSCNMCREDDPRRAAILRFNPDGTIPADNPLAGDPDPHRRPLWAWGLRNSIDFLWTPAGRLWANHNGSDGLGDNLPPEEIVIDVQGGQHYGWPFCYTPVAGPNLPPNQAGEVPDPRAGSLGSFDCGNAVPALFTDLAHSAPIGMTTGRGFARAPAGFADDLFVAYHGSWDTSAGAIRDCAVYRVRVENGRPVGSEPFVTGWRAAGLPCGDPATWGRPAGVAIGADGALFISDDDGGRIVRVVALGN